MTSNMKYLVSGSLDKSVKIFEFDTKQVIYDFQDERIYALISAILIILF